MEDSGQAARRLARQLEGLAKSPEAQWLAAARALTERSPQDAVAIIEALVAQSKGGDPGATRVLPAVLKALGPAVRAPLDLPLLRKVAVLSGAHQAEALLAEGEAARTYAAEAAARADAKLFTLPLGHLKTRARLTTNPDELSRLAVASEPSVVREVLKNGRLTEALVVRIASRRPARPEPLEEIARHPRWGVRAAVQKALVFNPYLPLPVAARLVPLLAAPELESLTRDGVVHPSLRAQAALLLKAQGRARSD